MASRFSRNCKKKNWTKQIAIEGRKISHTFKEFQIPTGRSLKTSDLKPHPVFTGINAKAAFIMYTTREREFFLGGEGGFLKFF